LWMVSGPSNVLRVVSPVTRPQHVLRSRPLHAATPPLTPSSKAKSWLSYPQHFPGILLYFLSIHSHSDLTDPPPVAITFLQHTDGALPHYSNKTWTFARGATATIDRDLGFIDTHLFHDIIGTHVCHHLVSSIPFYHAQEATIAIRRVMGADYNSDHGSTRQSVLGKVFMGVPGFMHAFWENMRHCKFVEESVEGSGVWFFRNLHGVGQEPRDLTGGKAVAIRDSVEKDAVLAAVMAATATATAAAASGMSSSRNMNAKRRLSHGLSASVPATLPLLAE
jgi:omega-6 fatty acid desaturase / acyl-lipid omega-6 desaturase (Delta-12 desaturase)